MANYCVAEDVQVALGYQDSFSTSTHPTLVQVNSIIDEITNEIDLYMNMIGIATQPTDARILARLKSACIIGSSARVGFYFLNNASNVDNTLADKYWTRYQEILKEIQDKPDIYGATAGGNGYIDSTVINGTMTEIDTNNLFQSIGYKP